MEIQYLQNLENSPVKKNNIIPEDIGVPESKILEFEQKLGVFLPKAFKEFLFLGGEYCQSISANALNQGFDEYDLRHELFQENLDDVKLSISRPYYVLTEVNGEQFDFIYLDEGDNPPVYNFLYWEDDEYDLVKKKNSLSTWIDWRIETKIKHNL